jgi:hypothetical protein
VLRVSGEEVRTVRDLAGMLTPSMKGPWAGVGDHAPPARRYILDAVVASSCGDTRRRRCGRHTAP